jgi:hypothetical protein
LNTAGIVKAVKEGNIQWHRHTLERMIERGITRDTVKKVLLMSEVIEDYPEDAPYPSALFLGFVSGTPFHVVAAFDDESDHCYVITVYTPDLEHFENDYKTRRQHED